MALWIVATPIGTLGDLSPRAKHVLSSADVIAAEDTRTTRRLLSALDLPAPELVALHAHNEAGRASAVAERAQHDEVVLVCDAGTPGVSDPGGQVVQLALELGVEVRSVPGPSALATALAASGFPAAPSIFLGFAPRKGRRAYAREALGHAGTVVVYEAPGRVASLVAALAEVQPAREAALCRELSKKFEEITRAPLAELATELAGRERIRGECVLVVGPGEAFQAEAAALGGEGLKDIARVLADRWDMKRRDVYQRLLEWDREGGPT